MHSPTVVGHIKRAKMYLVKAHREIDLAASLATQQLRKPPVRALSAVRRARKAA